MLIIDFKIIKCCNVNDFCNKLSIAKKTSCYGTFLPIDILSISSNYQKPGSSLICFIIDSYLPMLTQQLVTTGNQLDKLELI